MPDLFTAYDTWPVNEVAAIYSIKVYGHFGPKTFRHWCRNVQCGHFRTTVKIRDTSAFVAPVPKCVGHFGTIKLRIQKCHINLFI